MNDVLLVTNYAIGASSMQGMDDVWAVEIPPDGQFVAWSCENLPFLVPVDNLEGTTPDDLLG